MANKKLGFTQGHIDRPLFIRSSSGKITILIVYVDDIIVTRNNKEEVAHLKKVE